MPRLLVTSDFDGTLAPIVDHPGDARPLPAAAAALRALADLPVDDGGIDLRAGAARPGELSRMPRRVHLVGSHGAEFDTGFAHASTIDNALLGTDHRRS